MQQVASDSSPVEIAQTSALKQRSALCTSAHHPMI